MLIVCLAAGPIGMKIDFTAIVLPDCGNMADVLVIVQFFLFLS